MSLGDHLEELRARLILALLGLILGMVVSLIFGKAILRVVEWPYKATVLKKLEKTGGSQRQTDALALVDTVFRTLTDRLATDPNAPADLDPKRVAFLHDVFTEAVKTWIRGPADAAAVPFNQRLRTIAPAEAFMAYLKISLISGLILTAPWVFYQIWAFVAAGLYPKERRYVHKAVPFSAGLFIIGALFFLLVIARITLGFFLRFNDAVGVAAQWTLQTYISFVTVLMLVFGIAFQTPIAVFILVRTGLVGIATLRRVRKYVILGLAFLAAVATPPDVVSQVALFIPLYGLFELGIVLGWLAERRAKGKAQEATGPKPPSGPAAPTQTAKLPASPPPADSSGAGSPETDASASKPDADAAAPKPSEADSSAAESSNTDSSAPKPATDSAAPKPDADAGASNPPQADSSASQPDTDAGAPKAPDADPSAPQAPDGDSSSPEPPKTPPSDEVPPRS